MSKKRLIIPIALSVLAQSALAQAPAVATMQTERLFDFDAVTAPSGWLIAKSAPSEPNTLLLTPAGSESLYIDVTVDHTAKYYIWVRTYAPEGRYNDYYLKVGSEPEKQITAFTTHKVATEPLRWKNIYCEDTSNCSRGIYLAKGTTRLQFRMKEPNLGFDKIIVTAQPNFQPDGFGQDASIQASIPARPATTPAWVPPNSGVPTPDAPRLLLPKDYPLDALKAAEQDRTTAVDEEHRQMQLAWTKLRASANRTTWDSCVQKRNSIMAKALYYRLYGTASMGSGAVSALNEYLDDCHAVKNAQTGAIDIPGTRPTGEGILTSALVYDWVIAPQGPGAFVAEREKIVRRFLERAAMEVGFPPVQNSIAGHGAEAQLLRDQLSAALAFYGDYPRIYEIVGQRFFSDYVPVRNYVYNAGGFAQGTSYGPYRYQWDMFAAWIFKRMNKDKALADQDVFSNTQEQQLYHSLYQRRPDGQLMRDGDVYHGSYTDVGRYWTEPTPFMLAASYYQNSTLKREFVRQLNAYKAQRPNELIFNRTDGDEEAYLWLALFNNRAVKSAPDVDTASEWPSLTRYFDLPMASMIARTEWTKLTDPAKQPVIAYMKAGYARFGGHQHRDAGHFAIYYKGILASSSGIYSGLQADRETLQEYNSKHDVNYQKRTVAHNALTIYQAGEVFDHRSEVVNDGGQLFDRDDQPASLAALQSDAYAYGRAIKQRIGLNNNASEMRPAFSYLKGDIGKAYSAAKIDNYQRAFVFLNLEKTTVPAALLVFDRLTPASNLTARPKWLMHSVTKPAVPTVPGTEFSTTKEFTVTTANAASKLVNRTLFPASASAETVEGFVVDGHDFPSYMDKESRSEELGAYRVEVTPGALPSGESHYAMLNLMQVVDGSNAALPTTALTDTTGNIMLGALIDNRAVYFAKSALPVTVQTTLKLDAGTYNLLVTDLATGTWSVKGPSGTVEKVVEESHGTIYLPATAGGEYVLTPVTLQ
ncbi:heparinase II/III family protein [Pseudoduganella armeniaca]|nr:heparinase II/III family protein [Pseudoduganella armeniaca]